MCCSLEKAVKIRGIVQIAYNTNEFSARYLIKSGRYRNVCRFNLGYMLPPINYRDPTL